VYCFDPIWNLIILTSGSPGINGRACAVPVKTASIANVTASATAILKLNIFRRIVILNLSFLFVRFAVEQIFLAVKRPDSASRVP
jgi:hypothetical protein